MTKSVFTTGEAAKICKVSQQTIIRCFDSGQLKGFRVPGSRFRRIPRDQLFAFMKDNGIPTDALESGKRKILIVDDDESLVELMRDVFDRDSRFEVRTANNGFDAGMLVKEFRPDIVVLDVMLPDINGKEVCQRVRSDAALDDVRIICISGMVEQDKVADLKAAGANDFIQKPFRDQELLDGISEAVKTDQERRSARAAKAEVLSRIEKLTNREQEVLDLVVTGKPNKVIAYELGVSQRTVEIHRARVMEKMQAKSLADLVRMHLAS